MQKLQLHPQLSRKNPGLLFQKPLTKFSHPVMCSFSSWWFQPIWKILQLVKLDHFPKVRDDIPKIFELPPPTGDIYKWNSPDKREYEPRKYLSCHHPVFQVSFPPSFPVRMYTPSYNFDHNTSRSIGTWYQVGTPHHERLRLEDQIGSHWVQYEYLVDLPRTVSKWWSDGPPMKKRRLDTPFYRLLGGSSQFNNI